MRALLRKRQLRTATDVWAPVGAKGTVVRWEPGGGGGWALIPITTMDDLWGVWTSGPTDVWASSNRGLIYHWNGMAWSQQTLSTGLGTIHGTGPNDVWVADSGPRVWHWDGAAWKALYPPTVSGWPFGNVYAATPGSIWMVGDSNDWVGEFILRYRP